MLEDTRPKFQISNAAQIEKSVQHARKLLELEQVEQLHSFFSVMWMLQKDFISILIARGKAAHFPIDMKLKQSQQIVRDLLRDAADELHEACLTLKNSKNHKTSEEQGFDRAHFIEEVIDSMKFCLGALIYADVTPEEFIKIFLQKSKTNVDRQEAGY